MENQILFTVLVVVVAVQRVLELRMSKRNEERMLRHGGREHAAGHFELMRVMHTAWFASMLIEVWLFEAQMLLAASAVAFLLFAVGQSLRLSAMHALDWRWSVRIFTVPYEPAVTGGIYRYIKHPNYLGVTLEMAALPLLHGAVFTAITFSLANALLLAYRVQHEEDALRANGTYDQLFEQRARLLPALLPALRLALSMVNPRRFLPAEGWLKARQVAALGIAQLRRRWPSVRA